MSLYAERSKKIFVEGEINRANNQLCRQFIRGSTMKELSEQTIYNYQKDLEQWFKFMNSYQEDLTATEATPDDIEEFIFYCQQKGNQANRIKRRMSVISSFYIFLKKKGIVSDNPIDMLERPKNVKPVVRQTYLTLEQVKEMKKILKKQNNRQLELYALFSLSTMARVNAIANVKWTNLDFENCQVVGIVEKGGKENENMFFTEDVKKLLLAEQKRRQKEGIDCEYVFYTKHKGENCKPSNVTLGLWAKKIGQMIGLEDGLHPHDFRHTMSNILKHEFDMPLEDISVLLNHSSTEVTLKHYIKQDSSRLREKLKEINL